MQAICSSPLQPSELKPIQAGVNAGAPHVMEPKAISALALVFPIVFVLYSRIEDHGSQDYALYLLCCTESSGSEERGSRALAIYVHTIHNLPWID